MFFCRKSIIISLKSSSEMAHLHAEYHLWCHKLGPPLTISLSVCTEKMSAFRNECENRLMVSDSTHHSTQWSSRIELGRRRKTSLIGGGHKKKTLMRVICKIVSLLLLFIVWLYCVFYSPLFNMIILTSHKCLCLICLTSFHLLQPIEKNKKNVCSLCWVILYSYSREPQEIEKAN